MTPEKIANLITEDVTTNNGLLLEDGDLEKRFVRDGNIYNVQLIQRLPESLFLPRIGVVANEFDAMGSQVSKQLRGLGAIRSRGNINTREGYMVYVISIETQAPIDDKLMELGFHGQQ
jgi:hypothetical protein